MNRSPFFASKFWQRSGEQQCQFLETTTPNRYRCSRCGHLTPPVIFTPERIRRTCNVQIGRWKRRRPWGLGDSIAFWIHTLSFGWITSCVGCSLRAAQLNRLVPWGRSWKWWANRITGRKF